MVSFQVRVLSPSPKKEYEMQTHKIVEINENGSLTVESILPKEEYEIGGSKYGYAFRFIVGRGNLHSIKHKLGLTSSEIEELVEKVTY